MSETVTTPVETTQPQVEKSVSPQETVLKRLSEEFGEPVKTINTQTTTPEKTTETVTTTPTEPTTEEKTALANKAKELGLPENATKEEIETADKAKTDATTWRLDEVAPSKEEEIDGTWKGLAETFELGELPADYSEERGFEIIQDLFKQKLDAVKQEAIKESSFDRFSDVPETQRAEAQMLVDLLKTGQTLEQINAPFTELAQIKALDKEALVRTRLESQPGWDSEMVDAQMEKIIEGGSLEVEYKIAKAQLDTYEQSLNYQRQEQIKNYQAQQKQIQEQKFNQESAKLKHALGGVQEYLGKKLTPEVKALLENELTSGKFHSMDGSPEEKVDYLLYKKFGKAGIASFQARALEKVVVEHKQNLHNVPIVNTTGNANRIETGGENMTEAQRRLIQEFGT